MPTYLYYLIPVLSVLFVLFCYFVYCFVVVVIANRKVLGVRGKDPDNPCYLTYDDYAGELDSEAYVCGYYGKAICGYVYTEHGRKDFRGFVILAHGLFGTHVQYYMDIYMLCKAGYKVLAYDQYGVGESEGHAQEYLAHGIYVMENVITDVLKAQLNDDLPLFLYGHSWGAYSAVGAMKRFPQLKGVISRSGPVSPAVAGKDLLRMVAPKVYRSIAPCYGLCVFILLGFRYSIRSTRGFRNRTTPVLLIQAEDDNLVPFKDSLVAYVEKHPKTNVRIFTTKDGRHNTLLVPEGQKVYSDKVKAYWALVREHGKDSDEVKAFIASLNRREMYPYRKEVADQILSFMDDCLKA